MKLLLPVLGLLVSAGVAPAQVRAAPPFHSVGGWGSVAFPGTGRPPSSGYVNMGRHPGQLRLRTGRAGGLGNYRQQLPLYYAYPVYVGGYSDAGYAPPDPGYAGSYAGSYAPPPPAPAAPTVFINQNFAPPAPPAEPVETIHTYDARPPADNSAPDPQYYLIALKDHSVYSAVAYWVEDGTLHYITTPNIRNQTSLDLVDMALTAKLNQDRGVTVSLPPAR